MAQYFSNIRVVSFWHSACCAVRQEIALRGAILDQRAEEIWKRFLEGAGSYEERTTRWFFTDRTSHRSCDHRYRRRHRHPQPSRLASRCERRIGSILIAHHSHRAGRVSSNYGCRSLCSKPHDLTRSDPYRYGVEQWHEEWIQLCDRRTSRS